jgi:hypothetical protein
MAMRLNNPLDALFTVLNFDAQAGDEFAVMLPKPSDWLLAPMQNLPILVG